MRYFATVALLIAFSVLLSVGCKKERPPESSPEEASATRDSSVSAPDMGASKTPDDPTHRLRIEGDFTTEAGDVGGTTIPPEAIEELNRRRLEIFRQVLYRYDIRPTTRESAELPVIEVHLGDAHGGSRKGSGLQLRVTVRTPDQGKRSATRSLPPTPSGRELVTNLDHSFDAALGEAIGKRH